LEITKSELEILYLSNKNKVVCEKLGISEMTLIKLLKENGIKNKGKGNYHNKIMVVG